MSWVRFFNNVCQILAELDARRIKTSTAYVTNTWNRVINATIKNSQNKNLTNLQTKKHEERNFLYHEGKTVIFGQIQAGGNDWHS